MCEREIIISKWPFRSIFTVSFPFIWDTNECVDDGAKKSAPQNRIKKKTYKNRPIKTSVGGIFSSIDNVIWFRLFLYTLWMIRNVLCYWYIWIVSPEQPMTFKRNRIFSNNINCSINCNLLSIKRPAWHRGTESTWIAHRNQVSSWEAPKRSVSLRAFHERSRWRRHNFNII